jgi:hypothetical protein
MDKLVAMHLLRQDENLRVANKFIAEAELDCDES